MRYLSNPVHFATGAPYSYAHMCKVLSLQAYYFKYVMAYVNGANCYRVQLEVLIRTEKNSMYGESTLF
jgi:hypothetical protein